MQVCLYFVNLVLEDYENYNFWHTPDMVERRNMYPHRFPPIREPLALTLAITQDHNSSSALMQGAEHRITAVYSLSRHGPTQRRHAPKVCARHGTKMPTAAASAAARRAYCCAGYPYRGIYIFVPCAVLAALGIWVPATASVMTLDMLWNSSELIWSQM